MNILMRGNYLFVTPGDPAFKVASNFTNYLELGALGITSYYLEARVENGSFLVNADLLDHQGRHCCKVRDNFPEPTGCRKERTLDGYRILGPSNELLLGIEVHDRICHLKGTIYDSNGSVVARDEGDDFLVFHGPLILGRSGSARGVVVA